MNRSAGRPRDLADRLGVSRATVRQAVYDILIDGRVKRSGRNTVKAGPKSRTAVVAVLLYGRGRTQGHRPGRIVVGLDVLDADEALAADLGLAVGDESPYEQPAATATELLGRPLPAGLDEVRTIATAGDTVYDVQSGLRAGACSPARTTPSGCARPGPPGCSIPSWTSARSSCPNGSPMKCGGRLGKCAGPETGRRGHSAYRC